MKDTKNYFDKQEITDHYPLTISTINYYIQKGIFPKPDLKKGRKNYWHRISVEEFLKVYNKVKAGQTAYTVDFERRRQNYLREARNFVEKHNINSAFQYRDKVNNTNTKAPSPETLFCYSITMEEILNVKYDLDNVCFNIINLLKDNWITIKEIAFKLKVSERTVYRKLEKIKTSGYEIESSIKGIKIK